MINIDGVHLAEEVSLRGTQNIVFPKHSHQILHIALDIGGSLAKVVYFTRNPPLKGGETENGGRLNFARFETEKLDECLLFIKNQIISEHSENYRSLSPCLQPILLATGGGSIKYHDVIVEKLGVKICKHDEMDCLVKGIDFLVKNVPREVFHFQDDLPEFEEFPPRNAYPYMLVNIGSGVSILKVTSENTYERVSGSSLGGGTFWGLLSAMSKGITFEEMLELSKHGNNENVDLLVGDIYGMDYSKIGLKASTIASSLGKLFKIPQEERENVCINDIARSLLYMICNNIGQIAYLNARNHGVTRIYFGGFFICGHKITMNALSYAIRFWSKGEVRALFLRHEGYIGAVGAFLQEQ